jgi:hypothetical protein
LIIAANAARSRRASALYTELKEECELQWADKIGLGFELPRPFGQLGQLRIVSKVAK